MADVRELPDHVREFVDMSKEYLRQETVEPAKQLGRLAGLSIAAGLCWSLTALFTSVAGIRYLSEALPEGDNWSALSYVIGAVALAIVLVVLLRLTASSTSKE